MKRFWQALSLRLFGKENVGLGYFDPESRKYFSTGATIEDHARLVG
jgi:hypothetical protein